MSLDTVDLNGVFEVSRTGIVKIGHEMALENGLVQLRFDIVKHLGVSLYHLTISFGSGHVPWWDEYLGQLMNYCAMVI